MGTHISEHLEGVSGKPRSTETQIQMAEIPVLRSGHVSEDSSNGPPHLTCDWLSEPVLRDGLHHAKQVLACPPQQTEGHLDVPVAQNSTVILEEGIDEVVWVFAAGK
jgi:hypothetical protein